LGGLVLGGPVLFPCRRARISETAGSSLGSAMVRHVLYKNANGITGTHSSLIGRASLVIMVVCETAKLGDTSQLKARVTQVLACEKPFMIIVSKSQDVLQALEGFSAIIQCKDCSRRTLETAASFIFRV
jgi:hypothetical protein